MVRRLLILIFFSAIATSAQADKAADLAPLREACGKCWVLAAAGDGAQMMALADMAAKGVDGLGQGPAVAAFFYEQAAKSGAEGAGEAFAKSLDGLSAEGAAAYEAMAGSADMVLGRPDKVGGVAALMEPFVSRYPKRGDLMEGAWKGDPEATMTLGKFAERKKHFPKDSRMAGLYAIYALAHGFGSETAEAEMDRLAKSMGEADFLAAGGLAYNPAGLYEYREEFGVEFPRQPFFEYREEFGVE